MTSGYQGPSAVLAAMAEGIGDSTFASLDWVETAGEVLREAVKNHAEALADLGDFTLCEVAHNPPAYLHTGATLAWHARFSGASVDVNTGELDSSECDFKVQGDHSVMSNLARIQYHGKDPALVSTAQTRLYKLTRWQIDGALPEHPALGSVLRTLHDRMAAHTMPRFTFMTPEWVSSARHILSTRASSDKYAPGIQNTVYTFSEEFTDTPQYAFPDGSHGGFWVHCDHGQITVGAGPLPTALEPADTLT